VWITSDVNRPNTLLAAQLRGELVIFAGAGVSVDAPSGLPLFDKLAALWPRVPTSPSPKTI
jgi:hypothetical protein